jgi:DNA-binding transcriptional ArsR family regulator
LTQNTDPESEPRMSHGPPSSPGNLVAVSQTLRLLCAPRRLEILSLLSAYREMHVGAICEAMEQSQTAVSRNLSLLKVAGLVTRRRDGQFSRYSISPGRGAGFLTALAPIWDVAKLDLR